MSMIFIIFSLYLDYAAPKFRLFFNVKVDFLGNSECRLANGYILCGVEILQLFV